MHILLQDGFQNESVTIRVNGKEVYRKENVTSKSLTGIADRIDVEGHSGSATVLIQIPGLGLAATVRADPDNYVVFYLEDGTLKHSVSDRPFGSA